MEKVKQLWLVISLIWLFAGCRPEQMDDCITSYGNMGTEMRLLDSFNRLEVGDRFHVVLVQDTNMPPYIILSGGRNMFKGVKTEVKRGKLRIENHNSCNFVRDFKKVLTLTINARYLNDLSVSSATDVVCKDTLHIPYFNMYTAALADHVLWLNTDEIFVNSINSGSVTLAGEARVLKGSIEEVTNLDASDLMAREVLIDSHTTWDCTVNASDIIYVRIYNSGNIFYIKEPSVLLELNKREGKGNLLKKE